MFEVWIDYFAASFPLSISVKQFWRSASHYVVKLCPIFCYWMLTTVLLW